ncbi:hypothetical protein Tdes44962_MAKER05696 [Teratosphaeria destructans]|uniref:Uncharacterized protein n=1 Tax=Teratosphaeria destructans TaxID=418781 RepID=A0A9W7VYH1_9PEZI|nr:hypothetical protein Tdes44962_MAKER05696 [Teratosphaeria destructans]
MVARLVVSLGWDVDELQDEGSPGHDATSSRKEISSNNVLKHRGLAGGLRTDDDYLWQIEAIIAW